MHTNWREHRLIRLGAGLVYYGMFALVPLVSLLLFFMYYEAEILLAGAELTNVIWRRGALTREQDDGVRTTTKGEPT